MDTRLVLLKNITNNCLKEYVIFIIVLSCYYHHYYQLLVCGTVFARMSPNQKAQLVTALMEIGLVICINVYSETSL